MDALIEKRRVLDEHLALGRSAHEKAGSNRKAIAQLAQLATSYSWPKFSLTPSLTHTPSRGSKTSRPSGATGTSPEWRDAVSSSDEDPYERCGSRTHFLQAYVLCILKTPSERGEVMLLDASIQVGDATFEKRSPPAHCGRAVLRSKIRISGLKTRLFSGPGIVLV